MSFITIVASWYGLVGILVGSFINVVAYRLPLMMEREWKASARQMLELASEDTGPRFDLLLPSSRCPHCGHVLRAWENIPLLSYVLLRGQCRGCHVSISMRYPMVELVCGLLSAWVGLHFGLTWQAGAALLLTWGLLAALLIDLDYQLLPDTIVLPLLWAGLMVNTCGLFVPLVDAVLGAAAGYLALWLVYWGFKLITGKEGIGHGDFKLLAVIGAWGGWSVLPATILAASVLGLIFSMFVLRRRSVKRGVQIAFGPYIVVAGWVALSWSY